MIDTVGFRRAQSARLRGFVDEHVAEHGPLDQARLADIDRQLDDVDAKLAEAESEA